MKKTGIKIKSYGETEYKLFLDVGCAHNSIIFNKISGKLDLYREYTDLIIFTLNDIGAFTIDKLSVDVKLLSGITYQLGEMYKKDKDVAKDWIDRCNNILAVLKCRSATKQTSNGTMQQFYAFNDDGEKK